MLHSTQSRTGTTTKLQWQHVFSSILVSFSFSPTRGIFDPIIISNLGLGPVPHVLLVTLWVMSQLFLPAFNMSRAIYPSVEAKCSLGVGKWYYAIFVPFQFVGSAECLLFHILNQDFDWELCFIQYRINLRSRANSYQKHFFHTYKFRFTSKSHTRDRSRVHIRFTHW